MPRMKILTYPFSQNMNFDIDDGIELGEQMPVDAFSHRFFDGSILYLSDDYPVVDNGNFRGLKKSMGDMVAELMEKNGWSECKVMEYIRQNKL